MRTSPYCSKKVTEVIAVVREAYRLVHTDCTYRFQLSIMSTMFQLKDSLKNTWQHLRSKHWHQLDHVATTIVAFIDFVKAFDTVNRELLFITLRKLGYPPKFIRIIKKLYTDVHARLIVDGELTQSLEYNSGVKQGCRLAPTLFGIYAEVLLWLAFKKIKHTCSVQIRLRYDGDLFDLRRLKAKTKALTVFIRDAQYADDISIFSDTPEGLQSLLTSYNDVAKRMGLCINTVKTETMCIGNTADFFVDGTKLANVTRFKYLGSYVSSDCSMKEELASRIQAMSCAFGRLRKRVFDSHDHRSRFKRQL